MSAIRQILVSTFAFAVLSPAALHATDMVQYVGGTVKSIPKNATGSLSLNDGRELRFNYGQSVYKLPYNQITSTDIIESEGRHLFHRIPVPSFGRSRETLVINYKDATGQTGKLDFELSSRQAADVRETIAAVNAAQNNTDPQSGEWWGDKYWKTNRNKASWEAGTVTASQTPAPAPAPPPGPGGTK